MAPSVFLLLVSACTNAVSSIIEQGFFARDKDLHANDLFFWKINGKFAMCLLTIPIYARIPVPETWCSSGVLEQNLDAIRELNSTLVWLLVALGVVYMLAGALSCQVMQQSNATVKAMLQISKTGIVWVFFLLWPGHGHEAWSNLKLIGILITTVAVVYYLLVDQVDQKPGDMPDQELDEDRVNLLKD